MTRRDVLRDFVVGAARGLHAATAPDRTVALSFDDAAVTHATLVGPLLKKFGFGGTFFVCEFPPDFADKSKYMTWRQIAALHDLGFEIGSHTRTHTHVGKMNAQQFGAELAYIENKCAAAGIPKPISFAYPGYETSSSALPVLKERGYRFARAGGSRAYDPKTDDSLLIPSFSTSGDRKAQVESAMAQAREGKIVVFTVHGVPDFAHPAVTTPPALFEEYLRYLRDGGYRVIAIRDLQQFL